MTSSLDSPIWVHSSAVHGQGVFATRHIAAGETVIEYVGEVISRPCKIHFKPAPSVDLSFAVG